MGKKPRYTCTCDPELYSNEYVYSRQIVVELPKWSPDRKRRLREGLTSTVCIDSCIVDAVKKIWSKGVETTGCCCGHKVMRGWVSVHPSWYEDMFKLGYEQRPVDVQGEVVMGLYTFFL
jgi:hypothetical protein